MKNKSEIMVSIVCTTYNHEKYIRDALEGFVSQKTSFPFEILVMDDASNDGTANIIHEYEKKYPDLIKPVYQEVNQYSQGLKPGKQNRDRAIGKYIALCEGDDYWIDDHKLQKQVNYMEVHPDCTFCFTNGKCEIDGKIVRSVIPWTQDSKISDNGIYDLIGVEQIGYIPTASFVFKRKDLERLPKIRPTAFHGDNCTKVGMTSLGYAYCFDEETCVYRFKVPGSVTTSWKSVEQYSKYADRFIEMYEDFYNLFGAKYWIFHQRALEWETTKFIMQGNYKALRNKKYKEYFKKKGLKAYIKYLIIYAFPNLYARLRRLKNGRNSL